MEVHHRFRKLNLLEENAAHISIVVLASMKNLFHNRRLAPRRLRKTMARLIMTALINCGRAPKMVKILAII